MMGFLRKAAIIGTGGMARAVINPNSKKARTAKATERQLRLEQVVAARDAAYQAQILKALQPPQQAAAALPAPGWYPDPAGRHPKRYWDGRDWTERVVDENGEHRDPI